MLLDVDAPIGGWSPKPVADVTRLIETYNRLTKRERRKHGSRTLLSASEEESRREILADQARTLRTSTPGAGAPAPSAIIKT